MLGRIDAIVSTGEHRDVPVARLAPCAAASIPRARPETMAKPASARSRASFCVNFRPAPEALREPTIATIGSDKAPSRREWQ